MRQTAAAAAAAAAANDDDDKDEGVGGQKHGLEDADLGLFYAGVRHKYAPPVSVFLASVQTGKGRRKFAYFFSAKK